MSSLFVIPFAIALYAHVCMADGIELKPFNHLPLQVGLQDVLLQAI
jgi:hypothetical protein